MQDSTAEHRILRMSTPRAKSVPFRVNWRTASVASAPACTAIRSYPRRGAATTGELRTPSCRSTTPERRRLDFDHHGSGLAAIAGFVEHCKLKAVAPGRQT